MTGTEFKNSKIYPNAELRDLVAYYWQIETTSNFKGQEISVPDGYVNLLFTFNPVLRDQQVLKPDIYIIGPRNRKSDYSFSNSETCSFGVCLVPTALKRLFGINISTLKNQALELREIDKRSCFDHGQFQEKMRIEDKIELVNRYLVTKDNHYNDRQIASIINRIFYDPNLQSVKAICSNYKLTAKQLYRNFTAVTGLSPVEFIRISRMNKFFHYYQQEADYLTSACYSAGYYDQSHFIKEFKKIIGCSPTQLFSTESQLLRILSSDIDKNISHLSSYSAN
ncbi:MAG: helix-turn-helix transcriptional regulator [Calditrichaeota bacterium]|nr:helix-turn-helix transcriptional regulator [Calditrichota bacterium]